MYQNTTEGNLRFFDGKLSKSTTTYNLELGLYTSITDLVEAKNTLIQERNNHKLHNSQGFLQNAMSCN